MFSWSLQATYSECWSLQRRRIRVNKYPQQLLTMSTSANNRISSSSSQVLINGTLPKHLTPNCFSSNFQCPHLQIQKDNLCDPGRVATNPASAHTSWMLSSRLLTCGRLYVITTSNSVLVTIPMNASMMDCTSFSLTLKIFELSSGALLIGLWQ